MCGVQQNAQAHYEKGHRLPKADYLMLAAEVIDVGYLLKGVHTSESISLSDIENDVVSALRKMPPDDQQAIRSICLALVRHVK
jgi:transcriptional regulator with XRE-family HTH domain